MLFIGLVIVVAATGSNPFQLQVLIVSIVFLIPAIILLLVGRKRMNLKKLIKQAEDKVKEVNNQSSTIIDEARKDAQDRIEASKVEAEKIIKDAKFKSSEIINNAQLRSSKLITSVKIQHDNLVESVKNLSNEKEDLLNEVKKLNSEVLTYNAFILDYDNITSEECKDKLAIVKLKQKDLITTESAIIKNQTELQQIISNNMTVTVNENLDNSYIIPMSLGFIEYYFGISDYYMATCNTIIDGYEVQEYSQIAKRSNEQNLFTLNFESADNLIHELQNNISITLHNRIKIVSAVIVILIIATFIELKLFKIYIKKRQ